MKKGMTLLMMSSVLAALAAVIWAQVPFPNYPEPYLPEMGECIRNVPTPLPEKWEAVTLMSPYLFTGDEDDLPRDAELQVGRFVYDGEAELMRATRYGVTDNAILDLLIAPGTTWLLVGDYEDPTCLAPWKKTFDVPSRIWQSPPYECVGSHRTAPDMSNGPVADWWKQRSPVTDRGAEGQAADWFWFDDRGYPTRTMFWAEHSGLPAVLGDFAYTNFYSFNPVEETRLKGILAKCPSSPPATVDEDDLAELGAYQNAGRTNHPAVVGELIPGLSFEACAEPGVEPPAWPVEFYATSISTAAKFATPKPLATSVYFKPETPEIRTRLHKTDDMGKPVWSDALLVSDASYGVDISAEPPYPQIDCGRGPNTSLPGSPHSDWGERGLCQCMGVIKDNPVLSPGRTTQLVACPLADYSGNTLFWMWYTVQDPPEPVVFLQTRPDITIGTGLSLADYFSWHPQPVADNIFTRPTTCEHPPPSSPVPPGACLKCHIQSTNNGKGQSTWAW